MKKIDDNIKDASGAIASELGTQNSQNSPGENTPTDYGSNPNLGNNASTELGAGKTSIPGDGILSNSISNNAENIVENSLGVAKLGGALVYIIMNRLYYLIAIPAMIITYNVFKALNRPNDKGVSIFDRIFDMINKVLENLMDISAECPDLIGDFPRFLECIGF